MINRSCLRGLLNDGTELKLTLHVVSQFLFPDHKAGLLRLRSLRSGKWRLTIVPASDDSSEESVNE